MDFIQINCDECNTDKHPDATLIYFNYYDVKNIIDTNYLLYINYCEHKINELKNLFTKECISHYVSNTKCICAININYVKLYKRFVVKKCDKTSKLKFTPYDLNLKEKDIDIEEFMSTIKKGTLIHFIDFDNNYNKINYDNVLSDLREALFEHNTGFIISRMEKKGYVIFKIDTPNYTKSAFKV